MKFSATARISAAYPASRVSGPTLELGGPARRNFRRYWKTGSFSNCAIEILFLVSTASLWYRREPPVVRRAAEVWAAPFRRARRREGGQQWPAGVA
jgi:hypothetical protein